ncbi:MAG: hypothetical protein ACUVX1_14435 [Chloroflexota bacterium]
MAEAVNHVHEYVPGRGSVSVKVERNTKQYVWECKVDRPVQPGESFEQAAAAAIEALKRVEAEVRATYGHEAAA